MFVPSISGPGAVPLAGHSHTGPRFVLLTSGGIHARLLSIFLGRSKLNFKVVLAHPSVRRRRCGESAIHHWLVKATWRLRCNRLLRSFARRPSPVFARKHIHGGLLNSRRLIRTLQQLRPDYILLMNTGIVSEAVIRTARYGVLNAHPGLLPWIRGVNAVASSLLEKIAAGVTVHFVNEGIDTGPILTRYRLPVLAGDTLELLRERANMLALVAMIEAVAMLHAGEKLNAHAQSERYCLHRKLDASSLRKADEIVASGEAKRLSEQWKRDCPELRDGTFLLEKYQWVAQEEKRLPAENNRKSHLIRKIARGVFMSRPGATGVVVRRENVSG